MKGHGSLQYKKFYKDFKSSASASNNTKIELFTTDLNVTDSVVTYQIQMTSYKQVKIFQRGLYVGNGRPNTNM